MPKYSKFPLVKEVPTFEALEKANAGLYSVRYLTQEINALSGTIFHKTCSDGQTIMFLMFLPRLGMIAAFCNFDSKKEARQAKERLELMSLGYDTYILSSSEDARRLAKFLQREEKKVTGMRMLPRARNVKVTDEV